MTLQDALKECTRSKIWVFASSKKDLNKNLESLKETYGNKPVKDLVK